MSSLEIHDVHRSYRPGAPVLAGVSFEVAAGEVVSLLGRNGAGKTTLIHIVMGMLAPQAGSVRVLGRDPRVDPLEVKRRVGFVSEEQILPPFLRVAEVIDLHRGLFPTWDDQLAHQLSDRFAISPRARVKTLSKGQARQVALLCAVCRRPELLLLDEPAGGLDPVARRELLETAIQLLNETGTTILFSSHYMSDVERLANRVVMLHQARVLVDSALDQLQEEYSLALVPYDTGVSRDQLLALAACVGVRERSDALHAVLSLDPEASAALLVKELGIDSASCRAVGLEEMFIEVLGGQL
jgi:ABC-2 type transport system ATP-binding protein